MQISDTEFHHYGARLRTGNRKRNSGASVFGVGGIGFGHDGLDTDSPADEQVKAVEVTAIDDDVDCIEASNRLNNTVIFTSPHPLPG